MDAFLADFFTLPNMIALLSLAALEIVLGIDNIVFLAIITSKLHRSQQASMRRIGLILAMLQRILLLFAIGWVVKLTDPLFTLLGRAVSGRDVILIGGGLFLIAKATFEIHGTIEGGHDSSATPPQPKQVNRAAMLLQITLLDIVFSLDSVITAVGMVNHLAVMIAAVLVSVAVMVAFANPVSDFIVKHPTVKMLALSFLLLIGVVLVADGSGRHVEKGYICFAMGFSILVEVLNFKLRSMKKSPHSD